MSVWTNTFYDGGVAISEGDYWQREAQMGAWWKWQDGKHLGCTGYLHTSIDTTVRCPVCAMLGDIDEEDFLNLIDSLEMSEDNIWMK